MLSVKALNKTYRSEGATVHAAKDVSFEVGQAEVVTLLGPSGCGKTTTLRCIAGLEKPDSGDILIDDQAVYSGERRHNTPIHMRPIAMVFQSYAVWPHMTVFENVAYPLVVGKQKFSKQQIRGRVMQTLELIRIPELADRSAITLSGGQQQRVALARALIREPKLLLLDEPLSNLDAMLREEMRSELKELFTRTAVSALYVTHDLLEALSLSNRIVVMNGGTIAQVGSPRDLFSRPRDQFVAEFMGAGNLFRGIVNYVNGNRSQVETHFGDLVCSTLEGLQVGANVLIAVRPEAAKLSRSRSAGESSQFSCVIEEELFFGTFTEYQVRLGEQSLRVRSPYLLADSFTKGDSAYISIPPDTCTVIPAEFVGLDDSGDLSSAQVASQA